VVNQSTLPLEIIVVIDGPSEDLDQFLHTQSKKLQNRLEIIRLPNNVGAGEARNIAWNQAKGDYIAFLDADDAWHPRKLEIQYAFMKSNPDILISGHRHRIESAMPIWSSYALKLPEKIKIFSMLRLLIVNPIITPSVMVTKDCKSRFSSDFRFMEDYHLWLSIVANGGKLARLESELACIFKPAFGAAGLSSNMWGMEKGELRTYLSIAKENIWVCILLPILLIYSSFKFICRLIILRMRQIS
jgi:glycosyltransferase involved in cell wall biosynthesis